MLFDSDKLFKFFKLLLEVVLSSVVAFELDGINSLLGWLSKRIVFNQIFKT